MKRIMRHTLGMLLTMALCLAPMAALAGPAGFNFSGAVGVWYQQPGGDIENVDLDSDFNFGDKANFMAWARFEHPIPIVPDVKLDYNTVTFDDGRLSSSLDIKIVDLTAYWHIPMLRTLTNDILDVTWGVGGRYYDGEVDIHSFTGDLADNKIMPFVYAGARVEPIDWLALAVELRGWSASDQKTFDGLAKVEVYPIDFFFIGAGYHYLTLEDDKSSNNAVDTDMNIKPGGFFIEVGFDI